MRVELSPTNIVWLMLHKSKYLGEDWVSQKDIMRYIRYIENEVIDSGQDIVIVLNESLKTIADRYSPVLRYREDSTTKYIGVTPGYDYYTISRDLCIGITDVIELLTRAYRKYLDGIINEGLGGY